MSGPERAAWRRAASEAPLPSVVREIDLTANPRITELTRVMRHVSGIADPAEMLRAFSPWLGNRSREDYFITVSRRNMPPGQYKFTRVMPDRPELDHPGRPVVTNPWAQWEEIPTHTGGLVGEILERGEPRVMADLDLTTDPVLSSVMGPAAGRLKSLAAMPSFDAGESLNWSLGFSEDPGGFTPAEFEKSLLDMSMIGMSTRNLVARRQVEQLNTRLTAQLEQIARIQRALLPDKNPQIKGFEIATSYITSDDSGGDYYDYYHYPDGRLGVLIADVSGHGAGAATVMAMLRAIIYCYENETADTADFAQYCNAKLTASKLEGNFVTAFFCTINPRNGELVWTRAGHNPPRIRRADGSVEVITSAGTFPLGILDDLQAESDRGVLNPGDTLILYTDGITELHNRHNELFGEPRMDEALEQCSGKPECVVDTIHAAMYKFTGSMTRQDDQTLVVVRRTGDAP